MHGFALINHLSNCSLQIKVSQLWGPIPFVLLYYPRNLLVKLHYTLYTVTGMQYVWNAVKTNKQNNNICVIAIATGINFVMKTLWTCILNRNMKQTHIFLTCCIHFSDDFIPQLISCFSVSTLSYISKRASVNSTTRSALVHLQGRLLLYSLNHTIWSVCHAPKTRYGNAYNLYTIHTCPYRKQQQ